MLGVGWGLRSHFEKRRRNHRLHPHQVVDVSELKVEQHPDKTFIGRIERGFDFLGSVMKPAGLEMAPRAMEHCVERVSRLDEQGADLIRIGAYLKRWSSWAKSGLMRDGGQFVERAMEAISQRLAALATPHWPLPPT